MNAQSLYSSRRYRLALLLLMIIPLLPEFVILATGAVSAIMGWDRRGLCTFASERLAGIVDSALAVAVSWIVVAVSQRLAFFIAFCVAVSVWLCLCLTLVSLGWVSRTSRLLVGLAVTSALALLPYLGPWLALMSVADRNCQTNEYGYGTCVVFGGYISNAPDTVRIDWLAGYGVPLVFAIFGVYAIMIVMSIIPGRKTAPSVRR
jgi:hypothetical protein